MENEPGHNANNIRANGNGHLHVMSGQRTRWLPLSSIIWKVVNSTAMFFFRMYMTVLVVIYQWMAHLVGKILQPLEPAMEKVRKVPKQDISIKGIMYQYTRLIFLVALYVSPWAVQVGTWALEPLRNLRDWAVDYVEGPWNNGKAADEPVERED